MSKFKILYVSSEINPFLQTSEVGDYVRELPQYMSEKGMEIRILVPRFGCINERKNRLHEVVRLSGINIAVGDEEKPLTIKVASIQGARLQVYFIDNEDYFSRKSIFTDKKNEFHADNDERAIFFCKGVLETVKKLGWAPDIIHCHDWFTSFIPLYLKTTYRNVPTFKDTKCVFTAYDTPFEHQFDKSILEKAKMPDIEDEMLAPIAKGNYHAFIELGAKYADRFTLAHATAEKYLSDVSLLEKSEVVVRSESFASYYHDLYHELIGISVGELV